MVATSRRDGDRCGLSHTSVNALSRQAGVYAGCLLEATERDEIEAPL